MRIAKSDELDEIGTIVGAYRAAHWSYELKPGLLRRAIQQGHEADDWKRRIWSSHLGVATLGHQADPRESIREFMQMIVERPPEHALPYMSKKSADKAVSILQDAIASMIERQIDLQALVSTVVAKALDQLGQPAAGESPISAPSLNPSQGYASAVEAGAETRTRLFKGEDMLSSDQIAEKLGLTRETVNNRRREGELLSCRRSR